MPFGYPIYGLLTSERKCTTPPCSDYVCQKHIVMFDFLRAPDRVQSHIRGPAAFPSAFETRLLGSLSVPPYPMYLSAILPVWTCSRRVVNLSSVGRIVRELWAGTQDIRPEIQLDAYVIMPNHLHAIVCLPDSEPGQHASAALQRGARSLGALVAGYKSACTSNVNRLLGTTGFQVWQRNYHERVIRDARALDRMRRYVANNPARWAEKTRG